MNQKKLNCTRLSKKFFVSKNISMFVVHFISDFVVADDLKRHIGKHFCFILVPEM